MAADDDPADLPPRPLFGPVFWIVILLSLVCVAAGAAVAWLGPALFGPG